MAYDTSAHEHEFFAVQPETETRSHLRNRPWKACLEQLKAQNDLLTFHALAFSDFLRDAAPPPALNLGALLYPGRDPESNFSDCVLGKLRRLMLADVPAAVAALPITLIASKTTATLLATLETIHASGPLVEARRAIRGIFDILHDPVRPFASPERRAAEINGLFDSFLAACRTNAATFTTLWNDHCHPLLATRRPQPDALGDLSRQIARNTAATNRTGRKVATLSSQFYGTFTSPSKRGERNAKLVARAVDEYYKLVRNGAKPRNSTTDACRTVEAELGLGSYANFWSFRDAVKSQIDRASHALPENLF